jgi:hypothetical protein
VSGVIFKFCTPGPILGGTEGGLVPFSCFALLYSFWAVPRVSGVVFKFCTLGPILGGTEGGLVQFLCFALQDSYSKIPRVSGPISCFALPDSFLVVPRASGAESSLYFTLLGSFSMIPWASGSVLMCCAPELVSDGIEGVGTRFMFCAPEPVSGGTEGSESNFDFSCSRNPFRRYRGRPVQYSYFANLDSFSAVPRASCVFFNVLCYPTRFGRY